MSTEEKKPRITSITIENFKGIGAPVTIPIRPLTLLFGKNSAGKSTIIEALLLMHDWMKRLGPDLDTLTLGGDFIHLGGFKQFVHKHDIHKKVRIRVDCSLGDEEVPKYPAIFEQYFQSEKDAQDEAQRLDVNKLIKIETCFVEIVVRWSKKLKDGRGVVEAYKTGINDEWLFNKVSPGKVNFNVAHPLMQALFLADKAVANILKQVGKLKFDMGANMLEHLTAAIQGLGLEVPLNFYDPVDITSEQYTSHVLAQPRHLLSQSIVGVGGVINTILSDHRFLGPLRIIPKSGTFLPKAGDTNWADGSAAWEELVAPRSPQTFLQQDSSVEGMANETMRSWAQPKPEDYGRLIEDMTSLLNALKFRYRVKMKTIRLLDEDSSALDILKRIAKAPSSKKTTDKIKKALTDIQLAPAYREIVLVDIMTGAEMRPNDLGTGISQLIPVLVGIAVEFRLYSVEQPELHLHPAMQCDLGDAFLMGLDMDPNGVTIIETHSEHLILRLLRRIRETAQGQIPNENCELQLTPDDLAVLYVDQASDGMRVNHLRVDDQGQFMDEWPGGFFEEGFNEIVGGL